MAISLFGKGLLRSAIGGIRLPSFDEDDGSGTKLLQWLFGSGKAIDVVKDDGYTYIKDKANKGTDRLQLEGVKAIFDGVDGVVTIPHSDSLTFGNGTVDQPFSIAVWINADDWGQFTVIGKGTDASNAEYTLRSDGGNQLGLTLFDLTTSNSLKLETIALTAYEGQDIFAVATYDGSGVIGGLSLLVYDVNGVLIDDASSDVSSGSYTAMHGATMDQEIGWYLNGIESDGDIYALRVHNVELSQAQIDLLVANPNTILGTEVGKWNLDEGAGLTSFDSVDGDNMLPDYESDFSVDTDGITGNLVTVTGNESIAGIEDTLRGEATAVSSNAHYFNLVNFFPDTVGRAYKVSFDYYINPSTDNITNLLWYDGSGFSSALDNIGSWSNTGELEFTANSVSARIYLAGGTYVGTVNDWVQIKNVIITPVVEEGKHGTISGGVTWGNQDVVSFQNYDGFSPAKLFTAAADEDSTISPAEGWLQAEGDYYEIGFVKNTADVDGYSMRANSSNSGFILKTNSDSQIIVQVGSLLTFVSADIRNNLNNAVKLRLTRLTTGVRVLLTTANGDTHQADETTFSNTTATFNVIGSATGSRLNGHLYYIDNNGTLYNEENNWEGIAFGVGVEDVKLPAQTSTLDVFGEPLTYSGKAPKDGKLVESHDATLNGVDEYIDTGVVFSPSGDYEISGWFKIAATAVIQTFFDGRDAAGDGISIRMSVTTSYIKLDHNSTIIETTAAYDDGVWHKLVASKTGSTLSLKIYNISGALEETEITDTDATAITTTVNGIIGAKAFSTKAAFFNGQLANIKAVDADKTVFHYPLAEGAGLISYSVADATEEATPTYESDFSVDEDGWLVTGAAVESVDETLKITAGLTDTTNHYGKRDIFAIGGKYNIDFEYYIPSTTDNVERIRIYDGASKLYDVETRDTWHSVSEIGRTATTDQLRVYPVAATYVAYEGTVNDFIFVKNVVITPVVEVGGNGTIVATEVDFWANTNDVYHYNILNGFDRVGYFDGTAYVTVGTSDVLAIGETVNIVMFYTGNTDYAVKLGGANDYIRMSSAGRISVRSGTTTEGASAYNNTNSWVRLSVERENSTNYIFRLYDLSDTLINEDLINTIATPFAVDLIGSALGAAKVGIIKSVELTNQHKWTQVGGWLDEVGSDDGVITGTILEPKLPSGASSSISNPSGKYHNGAETKVNTNFTPDPELTYRGGIPDDNLIHNSDAFVVPEFFNNENQAKSVNYAVYDKGISSSQADLVDEAIKYSWDASELASVDRTLLSEWDVQDEDSITEATGVSLINDTLNDGTTGSNEADSANVNTGFSTYNSSDNFSFEVVNDGLQVANVQITANNFPTSVNTAYRVTFDAIINTDAASGITISNNINWADYYIISNGVNVIDIVLTTNSELKIFVKAEVCDFAISNMDIKEITGNNFVQFTAANQPALTDVGIKDALVTYNGVDNFMSQPVTSDNFQDLTRFEYWFYIYSDANIRYPLAFNDDGSSNDYILLQTRTDKKLRLSINDNGTNNIIQTSAALLDGSHICGIVMTGTESKIFVDGIEQSLTVVSGANTGIFIGGLVNKTLVDIALIAARSLASYAYYPNKEKYGLAIGGTTDAALSTAAERTNIFNHINKRFDLGL